MSATSLRAYHGDPSIKREYLERVRAHQEADQLLQGFGYWRHGRGCAVGCTIHGSSHVAYESELGIPQELAYLEDAFPDVQRIVRATGEACLRGDRISAAGVAGAARVARAARAAEAARVAGAARAAWAAYYVRASDKLIALMEAAP